MTHYWNRNAERNKRMLNDYRSHFDLKRTATLFGISVPATRNALKLLGQKFSKKQLRKASACHQHSDIVFEMEKRGCSLAEIAAAIGTGGRHVKRFLRAHGVTREFPTVKYGESHYAWKGRTIDKDGYVLIYNNDHPHRRRWTNYMLEHRLVVERHLGRLLKPSEVVHHKDGNKQNNSISNLQVFSNNGKHLRFELSGKVPKWTQAGLENMRKGIEKSAVVRRERILNRRAQDGSR